MRRSFSPTSNEEEEWTDELAQEAVDAEEEEQEEDGTHDDEQ